MIECLDRLTKKREYEAALKDIQYHADTLRKLLKLTRSYREQHRIPHPDNDHNRRGKVK